VIDCRVAEPWQKPRALQKSALLPCDFYPALPSGDLLLCAKDLFVKALAKKTSAVRRRRAADTAWRHDGSSVGRFYPVEVNGTTFDLMERFGGLKDSKTSDRQVVATALGKLLRPRWRRCVIPFLTLSDRPLVASV
jgi:hypothetical protein